jgi:hypothetical protein
MNPLIGFLLPPLIDVINRYVKDSMGRFWVSVGVCTTIASMMAYFEGNLSSIPEKSMILFGAATITYRAVYEDSAIQEAVRKY